MLYLCLIEGFHILGIAASRTLSSKTDPCLWGERLPHRPALGSEQAEEGCHRLPAYWLLLPSVKDHFGGFFPDLGPGCWALPLLSQGALRCLPRQQPSSRAAPSSEGQAGVTAILQQGRTGWQRDSERCCQIKEYAITLLPTQLAIVPAGLTVVFTFLTGLRFLPNCFHWLNLGRHQGRTFLHLYGQLPLRISQSQSTECLRVLYRYVPKSPICDPLRLQGNTVAC